MLNITGTDGLNNSYWQLSSQRANLQVESGANINAAGTYKIATGTVYLTTGGASLDRLDGAGLIFSNNNPTTLKIVDAVSGTPWNVTVKGPVTLAGNTTTYMSFTGATNTADLLDVQNGDLTLNGNLSLTSIDNNRPTVPLNFFDDAGAAPSIKDLGLKITDSTGGTGTGKVVPKNAGLVYYQVTIKWKPPSQLPLRVELENEGEQGSAGAKANFLHGQESEADNSCLKYLSNLGKKCDGQVISCRSWIGSDFVISSELPMYGSRAEASCNA
jgi:hypothetical protein